MKLSEKQFCDMTKEELIKEICMINDYAVELENKQMNKVYIIRYEEEASGEYSSGVSYVYESLEKAKNMLNEILEEELKFCEENELEPSVYEEDMSVLLDFSYDYTKYVIEEREVR